MCNIADFWNSIIRMFWTDQKQFAATADEQDADSGHLRRPAMKSQP